MQFSRTVRHSAAGLEPPFCGECSLLIYATWQCAASPQRDPSCLSRVQMKTKATRDHLIDVGLNLFHTAGYAETGVKDILAQARVAKGSFYHYFASKEAFAEEVLRRYASVELERAQAFLDRNELVPLERLRRYFLSMINAHGYGSTRPGCIIAYMSLEAPTKGNQLEHLLSTVMQNWERAIASYILQSIARGHLTLNTSPEHISRFILNGWEGSLIRMRAEKSDLPLKTFVKVLFDEVLKSTPTV
jgi:TetR/AcrR family transcriptional regulator, transcriptional repressor for nem operon